MKGKKPLLLAVLILALLAVALILPAAASGANDNQPVNWVVGNYNEYNAPPDSHVGFTVNVRQLGLDLTVEGFVLQKIMYTDEEAFADAPVVRRATEFWPEGWPEDPYWYYLWQLFGLDPDYALYYARFYDIGDDAAYPWPGLEEPSNADDIVNANIADFVIYLDAEFLADYYEVPDEIHWTTYPHRYVIVDFDDPEKEDLVQIYGLNFGVGGWIPQLGQPDQDNDPATPPVYNYDLVPVPAGNFQVHVGESAL